MLKLVPLLTAAILIGTTTNIVAQECQTRSLAFDIDQSGHLGPDDCRISGGICGGCGSAPGERWTIQAAPAELILLTATSSQVGMQVGQVGIQVGIVVRFSSAPNQNG